MFKKRPAILRWMALRLLWALGVRSWSDAGFEPRKRPPSSDDWRSFEDAFSPRVGTCRASCRCGREFWDAFNDGIDWEDGEQETLLRSPTATALNWAVSFVEFEGTQYVADCDCWRKRAERIRGFIDGHAEAIADYLKNERKRREREVAQSPVVDDEKGV